MMARAHNACSNTAGNVSYARSRLNSRRPLCVAPHGVHQNRGQQLATQLCCSFSTEINCTQDSPVFTESAANHPPRMRCLSVSVQIITALKEAHIGTTAQHRLLRCCADNWKSLKISPVFREHVVLICKFLFPCISQVQEQLESQWQ